MPVNDVSLCFNHYAILRLTMRISHAFVAIVVTTAGVVIGASVSDCAVSVYHPSLTLTVLTHRCRPSVSKPL